MGAMAPIKKMFSRSFKRNKRDSSSGRSPGLSQQTSKSDDGTSNPQLPSRAPTDLSPTANVPETNPQPPRQASSVLSPKTTITEEESGNRHTTERLGESSMHEDYGHIPAVVLRSETIPPEGIDVEPRRTTQNRLNSGGIVMTLDSASLDEPVSRSNSRRSSVHSNTSSHKVLSGRVPSQKIFPKTITCRLYTTFNEQQVFDVPAKIENLVWYDNDKYNEVMGTISKIKEVFKECGVTKPSDKIYLRYASCFVRGSENQISREFSDDPMLIDDEEILSDTAIREICGFIHDHPYSSFDLIIRCDYSSIDTAFTNDQWPQDKTALHAAIQREYKDKMAIGGPTIKDQEYLSLADQQVLVTPAIACLLIDEDMLSYPRLTSEEKRKLKQAVIERPASTLQAVCVFDGIPMRFLYHFLCESPHEEQGHSDTFDNLQTLYRDTSDTCDTHSCGRYQRGLIKNIPFFFPQTVKPGLTHSIMDDKAVVPVRYVHEKGENPLGSGAFSTVHEISIDPHYQLISRDVKKTYALKTFRTEARYRDGFDREIRMLFHLARYLPDEHILTHITSWEQAGTYYILYEKAHRNLRTHMEENPGGDLSKDRILWFFCQLRGLSNAVRRVHVFHEPEADPLSGEISMRKTGVIGRHHDIKPENILAFGAHEDLPILKLSDFGAGKFSSVRAYESGQGASVVRGTQTYVGPESQDAMGKNMTRPFDMWALGCVFVEFLLWFLGIKTPDGERTFADMRVNKRYHLSPEYFDYFWQRELSGKFVVNKAVDFVMEKLQRETCRGMQPFLDLVTIIQKLLVINPDDRIDALELFNSLDTVYIKAQVDLDRSPNRFSEIYTKNRAGTTVLADTSVPPDLAPIDKLDQDVSTTGRSRVRSLQDLRDLDDPTAISQPPVQGEIRKSTRDSGQQFLGYNLPFNRETDAAQSDNEETLDIGGGVPSNKGLLKQLSSDQLQSL